MLDARVSRFKVALAAVVIAGGSLLAASACRDTAEPLPQTLMRGRKVAGQYSGTRSVVTPAELHHRNPADWVGVSHNRFLRLIRDEMLNHRVTAGDPCATIGRVASAHPELLTDGRTRVTPAQMLAGCRKTIRQPAPKASAGATSYSRAGHGQLFFLASTKRAVMQAPALSYEASVLVDQVNYLIDVYTDPTSFSSALSSVVDAAAGLDSNEMFIVDAGVSVAQSSAEYWSDPANQANEVSAFDAGYGDCIAAYINSDPFGSCLGMSAEPYAVTSYSRARHDVAAILVASAAPMQDCTLDWGDIRKSDFVGAIGGAAVGVYEGGGWRGALGGGLVLGLATSAAVEYWNAAHALYCQYMM